MSYLTLLNSQLGKEYKFSYTIMDSRPLTSNLVFEMMKNFHEDFNLQIIKESLNGDCSFMLAKVRIATIKETVEEQQLEPRVHNNFVKHTTLKGFPIFLNRDGDVLAGKKSLEEAKQRKDKEIMAWIPCDKRPRMGTFDMAY